MSLEVGGEDSLDHQEPEAFELCPVQVIEEVVLRPREEEGPGRRSVVVLQHTAVIVQHRLREEERYTTLYN